MKKTSIILSVLILISILFTSCQKAKEPEQKKEAETQQPIQQTQVEEVKQGAAETKPLETKPEDQPKQEQPTDTPGAKEEKKETSKEIKPSPLTEEEQRFLWKMEGAWNTPNVFKTKQEAMKYLRILLKGDHANIIPFDPKSENYSEFGDDGQRGVHADLICTAIHALVIKQKEQKRMDKKAFELVLEVLKKKKDYPKTYACASKYIGWHAAMEGGMEEKATEAIPLLKEGIKHSDPKVRLQAAGSLLALGEPDIALPVLDELARQGEVEALPLLFEPDKDGVVRWSELKFWNERGLEIMKKAIDYPSDEVKGWAATALVSLNIDKDKAEKVALNIVKKLMNKTEKEYGIGRREIPGKTYTEEYLLPGYEGKDKRELEKLVSRDRWACWNAISALGRLKSKKAVTLLNYIKENNKGVDKVCWEYRGGYAEGALNMILEDGGEK